MCPLDFKTPLIHHIVYINRVKAVKRNVFLNFLISMYVGYKYPVNPPMFEVQASHIIGGLMNNYMYL